MKTLHHITDVMARLVEDSAYCLVIRYIHDVGKYSWQKFCHVRMEEGRIIVTTRESRDREYREVTLEKLWTQLLYHVPEKNKIRSKYTPSLYLFHDNWIYPGDLDSGEAFKKDHLHIDLWG